MPVRYLSWLGLAIAAGFLVVASSAFALIDISNLALGLGIGMLVVSTFLAVRYRSDLPTVITASASAIVSAWMIVDSRVFSLSEVQSLTLADGLALLVLALIGLTTHELTSERVVHSLSLGTDTEAPARATPSSRMAA
jgi:hypothetical protein